ncbi:hypothetical protein GQ607_003844 [Colletotrichum asianum]|uniref:Uncharacterized protein n=1 Tax=Colletotrichum asianum TaxID=702518 RepID=A0A8H3WKY1_9PEZI|nr:hypothetical protein GQ607_003844 [Colletotrichum asianum]
MPFPLGGTPGSQADLTTSSTRPTKQAQSPTLDVIARHASAPASTRDGHYYTLFLRAKCLCLPRTTK